MKDGTALCSFCQIRLFGLPIEFGKCHPHWSFPLKGAGYTLFYHVGCAFLTLQNSLSFLESDSICRVGCNFIYLKRSLITENATGHSYRGTAPVDPQLRMEVSFVECKRL